MKIDTKLKTTTIVISLLLTGAAQAGHWDRPSCYIDVHSGCYLTDFTPCTDQEYNDFLDNCDVAYPAGRRPGGSLVAPTAAPGLALKIR